MRLRCRRNKRKKQAFTDFENWQYKRTTSDKCDIAKPDSVAKADSTAGLTKICAGESRIAGFPTATLIAAAFTLLSLVAILHLVYEHSFNEIVSTDVPIVVVSILLYILATYVMCDKVHAGWE